MPLRFLADEGLERAVVERLRQLGHDVQWVAEIHQGAKDEAVLDRAVRGDRILVTHDLDFGALVYLSRRPAGGIVLLRLAEEDEDLKADAVEAFVHEYAARLHGWFAVLTPLRARFRRLPRH